MFTQEQNKSNRNKLLLMAASGLITLMLASAPARADHDHNVVAPLVVGFALGALVNYGHSSHHYYRYQYQRHGHSGNRSGHRSGHGYRSQYSNGHYNKGHSSQGRYSQKRGHRSSRDVHQTSRRKH
jgi:hypothetical protein